MTAIFPITIGRSTIRKPLPPPSSPLWKAPPPDHRQAACTHTAVTRFYDTNGIHPCQMCRRIPNIGWVYRCTQDYCGFLPESDFNTAAVESRTISVNEGDETWPLSQWMYEAVLKGQYTVEQFSTLYYQRQSVKHVIFTQNDQPVTPSSSNCLSDWSDSSGVGNNTTMTTIVPKSDKENSISDPNSRDQPQNLQHEHGNSSGLDGNTSSWKTIPKPTYPACSWICCQTCRPTYRDRAWQSLSAIVDDHSTQAPPVWELENRRVSNARVVATIGLPKRSSLVADSRYDSCSVAPLSTSDSKLIESGTERAPNSDTSAISTGIGSKSGFRATVRNALKGATINRTRAASRDSCSSASSKSSASTISTPLKHLSQCIPFLRRDSSSGHGPSRRGSRIVDDSHLQDSLILMIATNTPLPDAAGDMRDLHDGEVEVEDGVAVTEEGVGMGTPDIIIHTEEEGGMGT